MSLRASLALLEPHLGMFRRSTSELAEKVGGCSRDVYPMSMVSCAVVRDAVEGYFSEVDIYLVLLIVRYDVAGLNILPVSVLAETVCESHICIEPFSTW